METGEKKKWSLENRRDRVDEGDAERGRRKGRGEILGNDSDQIMLCA